MLSVADRWQCKRDFESEIWILQGVCYDRGSDFAHNVLFISCYWYSEITFKKEELKKSYRFSGKKFSRNSYVSMH